MTINSQRDVASKNFEDLSLRLAEDLIGIERCRPINVIDGFPRIMDRINDIWPHPGVTGYIDGLVISDRVDRNGFPPRVVAELCFLKELRNFLYPPPYEFNRRVEDLLHVKVHVVGIQSFAEIHGPKSQAAGDKSCITAGASEWGEIDSDDCLARALEEPRKSTLRLGDLLEREGLISEAQRKTALERQAARSVPKERLGSLLVKSGCLTPVDLRKALALQANNLLINLDRLTIAHDAYTHLSRDAAQDLGAVPVIQKKNVLVVAMDNPQSYRGQRAIDAIKKMTGLLVKPAWSSSLSVEGRLKNYRPGRIHKDA